MSTRRRWLQQASGASATAMACLAWPWAAQAHTSPGRVLPRLPAPSLGVTLHDGRKTDMATLLAGKATAMQLVFTTCSSTCPIQGALFAQVQAQCPSAMAPAVQLVSLSIDPLNDTPQALRAWLANFGAKPSWLAARPEPKHISAWVDFLIGKQSGPDPHTTQVFYFDARGRLALRTADFPKAETVVGQLQELMRVG